MHRTVLKAIDWGWPVLDAYWLGSDWHSSPMRLLQPMPGVKYLQLKILMVDFDLCKWDPSAGGLR